jgi:hypothetical protein
VESHVKQFVTKAQSIEQDAPLLRGAPTRQALHLLGLPEQSEQPATLQGRHVVPDR